MQSKSPRTTGANDVGRVFFHTAHFQASLDFNATHPVVISIAPVKSRTSVSNLSAAELEYWPNFSNIVLRILHNAFGTIEFDLLSAKVSDEAEEFALGLPIVFALKAPAKAAIGASGELFWLYHRPRNDEGEYPQLPGDIIKRVVKDLRHDARLVSNSHFPNFSDAAW